MTPIRRSNRSKHLTGTGLRRGLFSFQQHRLSLCCVLTKVSGSLHFLPATSLKEERRAFSPANISFVTSLGEGRAEILIRHPPALPCSYLTPGNPNPAGAGPRTPAPVAAWAAGTWPGTIAGPVLGQGDANVQLPPGSPAAGLLCWPLFASFPGEIEHEDVIRNTPCCRSLPLPAR